MANLFTSLPVPVGNGTGAPVNVSTYGRYKSIVVTGAFSAVVTLEVSMDGVEYSDAIGFTGPSTTDIDFAAMWMRVRVAGYISGTLPTVEIGAISDTTLLFGSVVVPAGNGVGAALNVSTFGPFKTIQCSGPFSKAVVTVETSEDGVSYGELVAFTDPDIVGLIQSVDQFLRVRVAGYLGGTLPVIRLGASDVSAEGVDPAGGVTSVIVQDEGVAVLTTDTLNFIGAGVTAAVGVGRADITIPGGGSPTISGTSGEAIAASALVGWDDAAGSPQVFKSDANGAGELPNAVGFNVGAVAGVGLPVLVQIAGEISVAAGLFDVAPVAADVGKRLYMSTTAGNITLTAPSTSGDTVLKVGILTDGSAAPKVAIQIGEATVLA